MQKQKIKRSFFIRLITDVKCNHHQREIQAWRMLGIVIFLATCVFWTREGILWASDRIVEMVVPVYAYEKVTATRQEPPKEYAYNERVPEEVVKQEIVNIARRFKVGEQKMLRIASCESGFDNLAPSKTSSALGVYQFINQTWEATDSWKVLHKSPTDYKANIWEAGLALSRGEDWKWNASRGCWK